MGEERPQRFIGNVLLLIQASACVGVLNAHICLQPSPDRVRIGHNIIKCCTIYRNFYWGINGKHRKVRRFRCSVNVVAASEPMESFCEIIVVADIVLTTWKRIIIIFPSQFFHLNRFYLTVRLTNTEIRLDPKNDYS